MRTAKEIVQEMLSDCDTVEDLMDDKEDYTVYTSYLRQKCYEILEALEIK